MYLKIRARAGRAPLPCRRSREMAKARRILDVVFLLAILFNLGSLLFLPENVAIHFGRGGMPDSWASRTFHVVFSTVLMVLLYAGFALSPKLLEGTPARYINLPNREYWLREENLPEAIRRMAGLMYSFGIATGLLLLSAAVLSAEANLSDPVRLNESVFLPLVIVFLVYTVVWIFRLFAEFRVQE
jgi:uncharacterized membrane protein